MNATVAFILNGKPVKEWDAVLMVLLDENFDAIEIH